MNYHLVGTYEPTEENTYKTTCFRTGETIFVPLLKASNYLDRYIVSPDGYAEILAILSQPDPFAEQKRQNEIAWDMHLNDPCGE